jgi:hypothetical protein
MKKPLGVTLSAVFVLLGSLLMLGFFVLLCLVLILSPGRTPLRPEEKLGMVLGLGLFGFLGTWGTTTAIGLFRLRNWGRVSILVFAGLLALTGVAAAPAILLIPAPPTATPNFGTVRVGMAAFYAALGLLGAFWLYYFSRRATRDAFGGTAVVESGGRPLSISIIGWWLLVTGVLSALASPLRLPVSVFIWIVTGWTAAAWYIAFGALYAYIGYGLLRLNATARVVAIGVLCFGAANGLIFFFFPGSDARVVAFMSRFRFGAQPPPTHFPGFMIVPMLLGIGVPLWFLITRRQAFQAADLTLDA